MLTPASRAAKGGSTERMIEFQLHFYFKGFTLAKLSSPWGHVAILGDSVRLNHTFGIHKAMQLLLLSAQRGGVHARSMGFLDATTSCGTTKISRCCSAALGTLLHYPDLSTIRQAPEFGSVCFYGTEEM